MSTEPMTREQKRSMCPDCGGRVWWLESTGRCDQCPMTFTPQSIGQQWARIEREGERTQRSGGSTQSMSRRSRK